VEAPDFSLVIPLFPVRQNFKRVLKVNPYTKFAIAKIVRISVTVFTEFSEVPLIPMITSWNKYQVPFATS
jgi:hypothetical protein